MTSPVTLVVRYREGDRAATEETLRRLVRKQGALLVTLGVLLGALVLAPLIGAATAPDGIDAGFVLGAIVLLAAPVALLVLGVRQLRRRPHLPETAVTITPSTVEFPAIDRPSAWVPRKRAEVWPRQGANAQIIAASGMQAARVMVTGQHEGKRRQRSIAIGSIDVDPQVIVDALQSP